ncbi:hypothetical protein SCG7109_BO_00040 [Chlamydiales bacterium SCGC AG-110-M15]|nr:hypothetical protein SCG7109_BO_00040 [Chlamydiales bacterium SCGC AG-110-M15]
MSTNPSVPIRFTKEERELALQAAKLSGTSKWTSWVRQVALQKARIIVEEYQALTLSNKDRDLFLESLNNPPELGKNLKHAISKYLDSKGS